MSSYELKSDETVLLEKVVKFGKKDSDIIFTLTNKNMIFEKEKGILKKKLKVIEIIQIDKIKMIKDKVQIKQKKSTVKIKTKDKNIEFTCNNILDAKKVIQEIINAKTETDFLDRTTNKVDKIYKKTKKVGGIVGKALLTTVVIGSIFKHGGDIKDNLTDIVDSFNK